MRLIFRSLLFVFFLQWGLAQGALTIEITQGVEGAVPIAVVPFGWSGPGAAPENIAAIISSDLSRSGRFEPLADRDLVAHPTSTDMVKFQNWRMLNVDNLVIGQVNRRPSGGYEVRFVLFDVFRGEQLADRQLLGTGGAAGRGRRGCAGGHRRHRHRER